MKNNILNFKNFLLKEEKSDKKIYFFHPKTTKDTAVEDKSIELINIYFDNPIIFGYGDLRGKFYKFVDEINSVVVLPYLNGEISPKTYKRLIFAFEKAIDIYYIHPKKYKIIKIENLDFFTEKAMDIDQWHEAVENDKLDEYFKEIE
jgi:hypothetical protein